MRPRVASFLPALVLSALILGLEGYFRPRAKSGVTRKPSLEVHVSCGSVQSSLNYGGISSLRRAGNSAGIAGGGGKDTKTDIMQEVMNQLGRLNVSCEQNEGPYDPTMGTGGAEEMIAQGIGEGANEDLRLVPGTTNPARGPTVDELWEAAKQDPTLDNIEERSLYGGAMRMDLPRRFLDLSRVQPIKDTNEVWLDNLADQSVIIDLLNYKPQFADHESALGYTRILASSANSRELKILEKGKLTKRDLPHLPHNSSCSYWYIISRQEIVRGNSAIFRDKPGNTVIVHLAVFRWRHVLTDTVVAFNAPVSWAFKERNFRIIPRRQNRKLFFEMLKTFRMDDWGLFV